MDYGAVLPPSLMVFYIYMDEYRMKIVKETILLVFFLSPCLFFI